MDMWADGEMQASATETMLPNGLSVEHTNTLIYTHTHNGNRKIIPFKVSV